MRLSISERNLLDCTLSSRRRPSSWIQVAELGMARLGYVDSKIVNKKVKVQRKNMFVKDSSVNFWAAWSAPSRAAQE